jgi:hypothetical protein
MGEKPKIAVGGVLREIRSGTDDSALMQKYHLSAKGLQSLFQKLVEKGLITATEIEQRTPASGSSLGQPSKQSDKKGALINPADAVRDIRSGMHDFDLMEKYRLSAKGLQSLFEHLVKAGLMEQAEFDRRMPSFDQTVEIIPRGKLLKFGDGPTSSKDAEEELDLSWECPVCGIYQTREYDRCPECGALVALLRRKRDAD